MEGKGTTETVEGRRDWARTYLNHSLSFVSKSVLVSTLSCVERSVMHFRTNLVYVINPLAFLMRFAFRFILYLPSQIEKVT